MTGPFSLALALCLAAAPAAKAQPVATAPVASAPVVVGPDAKAGAPAGSGADAPAGAAAAAGGDAVEVLEKLGEHVPADLQFYDAFMNHVSLRETFARGKPVVLTLVYFECPMLCSLVVNGLIKGLNGTDLRLGKDYSAITVSFNPKETPRDAAHHQQGYLQTLHGAEKSGAQDWPFLTGGEPQIKALSDAVGFKYRYDAESGQFEHPAVAVVLSPDGKITRYLYGVDFPSNDVRLAIVEASSGKVGTTLDRVLLKCFKYDPTSRRYRVYVWGLMRGGAGLVFVGLATMLGVLWRREAKKGTAA